jgi:tetratricopeptide (TPR) repeat protein
VSNRNPYRAAGTFGGPSYVERDADVQLIREICDNQRYPYFLAPRQSGKSSIIAHVMKKLDREKYQPVFLDISTFRQDDLNNYDNFLKAFASKTFSALKLSQHRRPIEDLFELLEIIIRNYGRQIIIFIDEIDHLLTSVFKDTFFGQIRAAFNARARDREFERIQFVLAGAAQPTQLISDRNMSPFNVGELIRLKDLTLPQITEMSKHLWLASGSSREAVCQKIYNQTSGSVYLTQLIFERLWEKHGTQSLGGVKPEHIGNVVEEIIVESPDNLHFINIYSGIINNSEMLMAFRRYIKTGETDSSSLEYLKITGITDSRGGYRNLIYQRVFGPGGLLALINDVDQTVDIKHLATSSLRAGDSEGKLFILPDARNQFFTGRSQILDDLHHVLASEGKVALSGMGGMGKTQTAVEYAYRHRGEYRAVLWAKADNEESLKAGYATIASNLNLPEKDETDKTLVTAAVKRWLERHPDWLLILDNADDLKLVSDLLRRQWGGHVLLTTRAHATGGISRIDTLEMTPEEGTLFLLRRAKVIGVNDALGAATVDEQELASEITRELGGLPLALDQAGAFIEEEQRSLAEYLELYRREGTDLRAARGGIIADHEPATITFSLAFRQVAIANAAAADMLRACAFLAPDAIPEEIFVSGAGELGENLAPMAGGGINLVKMIGEAGRFSLIRRNAKNGTIEIHRVVQQVLKDEMDEQMQRLWAERVVRALNESFPEPEHQNWPLCEKLLPHAQEAARLIEDYGFEFSEAARLLNQTGYYCSERAQYREAEPMYLQALSIREKALGLEHPDVATSFNNLAALYYSQGKYAEAEPLLVRALGIREKVFGSEHPDVATSFNNLAAIYDNQGKYAEAKSLYVRALGIREKVFGSEHPDVALSLNNLAAIYDNQGKYAEAESLYVRALSISEKVLGSEHPDVALSLNNLALLYNRQGKYTEAEPLHMRALDIREKVFGSEHPDVATSFNNLAAIYDNQGKYAEAESLYVRALSISEKVFGSEHPDVALSLNNLALLYNRQGKFLKAEQLLGRALSICEKVFGPEHTNSVLIRQNYVALLQRMRNDTGE